MKRFVWILVLVAVLLALVAGTLPVAADDQYPIPEPNPPMIPAPEPTPDPEPPISGAYCPFPDGASASDDAEPFCSLVFLSFIDGGPYVEGAGGSGILPVRRSYIANGMAYEVEWSAE